MRVSTGDQDPDAQRDALIRAGVAEENLYVDYTFGAKFSRPQCDVVNKVLRAGDVLVCTRLDRVGRSTAYLVSLLDEFRQRDVAFRFLEQGHRHHHRRRADGLPDAGRRRRVPARPHRGQHQRGPGRSPSPRPKLTAHQAELVQQLYDERENTVQEIADLFAVPRSTIYGYLNKSDQPSGLSGGSCTAATQAPNWRKTINPAMCSLTIRKFL